MHAALHRPARDHAGPSAHPAGAHDPARLRQRWVSRAGGAGHRIVAIGASVGGPDALAAVLAGLPAPFPVPVVLALHIPRDFTRELAQLLSSRSGLPVAEADAAPELAPGRVVLATGDMHLEVHRQGHGVAAVLHRAAPELSCRPSVNVLFRSVAAVYGPGAVGVVLTGMGHDGLSGCRAVRAAGGRVLVQDAATSLVWGMPGAVARAGVAHRVLPLGDLPDEIAQAVGLVRPSALGEALGHA